jgi:penicillin-binding protein 1A
MRSNYWGEGGHNAILVVGDFFRHILSAQFIDPGAQFPYARPREFFWEPFLDRLKDWWLGESTGPVPVRPSRPAERDLSDAPEAQISSVS